MVSSSFVICPWISLYTSGGRVFKASFMSPSFFIRFLMLLVPKFSMSVNNCSYILEDLNDSHAFLSISFWVFSCTPLSMSCRSLSPMFVMLIISCISCISLMRILPKSLYDCTRYLEYFSASSLICLFSKSSSLPRNFSYSFSMSVPTNRSLLSVSFFLRPSRSIASKPKSLSAISVGIFKSLTFNVMS